MSFVDEEVERDVISWLESITKRPRDIDASLHDWLKDGKVLIEMINVRQTFYFK